MCTADSIVKSDTNAKCFEEKQHPLTEDHFQLSRELAVVHTSSIAAITRAANAVSTLSRIVHNSLSEPDASGAQPLDAHTVRAILAGIEVIGDAIHYRTEEMYESAAAHAALEGARER
ncbi:hypothetical protein [Burkholderia gladioli]|uniref:hypothetical protein n=1 Tax=Burkholderia gladioli TaxID=28095 RepID=UPI003EDF7903